MFYVNTTTKKFVSAVEPVLSNSIPCDCGYCCQGTQVPVFLRTRPLPVPVAKPYLTHYQTAVFDIQFKDFQGVPYDLTDTSLVLAVDNTFSHSDSLVCLSSDLVVTEPLQGIVRCTVKCSSQKFGKLVAVKMPQNQIWMQITAYTRDNLQGTVLLLDRGIHLQPKLYTTQGEPEPLDPNYYTKQQIDTLLLDLSDSFFLETVASKDDLRNLQAQISNSLAAIRNTFSEYYTKVEMDDTLSLYASNSRVDNQVRTLTALIDTKESASNAALVYDQLRTSIASKESLSDAHQEHAAIRASIKDLSNSITILKGRTASLQSSKQDASDAQQMEARLHQQIETLQSSINTSIAHLSDSLAAVKNTFSNYYTKGEVNDIAAQLSNSIASVKSSLGNYYTKSQVDNIAGALSNSIAAVKSSLGNYYTKQEADNKFLTEHQDISYKADKADVYSKSDADNRFLTEHQSLQDYYTKEQVDTLLEEFSDSIDLSNYYTKPEVDALIAGLSNSTDLSNYYTKSQTDNLLNSKQDLSDALQMKAAFEAELGAFSDSIAVIKSTFSNYYTKAETDELLSEFSNSDIEDLQNRVTILENKPAVSVKGSGAVNVQGSNSYTVSLSVDDNIFGIIGQLTSKLTMARLDNPQQGFAATYQLQGADGNPIGDKINIIQDILLQDMIFIPHATAQDVLSDSSVILNDPYLKVICYVQQESQQTFYKTVYVPVKDLVDTYTAGNGLQLVGTQFNITIDSDSQTSKYLSLTDKLGLRGIDTAISSAIAGALNNYYDKTYIDNALKDLSDSIAAVRGLFGSYYTKLQTDAIAKSLSDSIAAIKESFSDYYTKSEIDSTVAGISNSIAAIKSSFENYYTKTQVDTIAEALSNSIAAVKSSLDDYYNKAYIDNALGALSDSLETVKEAFGNYYNKEQIDSLAGALSNSIAAIKGQFDNYYDKSFIDNALSDISDSLAAVKQSLSSFATKQELEQAAAALSDSIASIKSSLGNYYTSTQVDSITKALSDSIANIKSNFDNYYDKAAVDSIAEALSDSIASIKSSLGNYYTKQQTDTFIGALSNSIEALGIKFNDYYTKDQIDALLDSSDAAYISIIEAPQNKITLEGLMIPVGLQTSQGTYYPIQKETLSIGSNSVTIDIDAYLVYDGVGQFHAPWKIWFIRQMIKNVYVQVSDSIYNPRNYYTKDETDIFIKHLSDSIASVKSSLGNYYTKSQVDNITGALSNSIVNIKDNFSNYYTKQEINDITGALSDSISAINNKFNSYYTKTEANNLLDNKQDLSDALQMSNAISALQQVRIQTITLSNPQSNVCTITGTAAVLAIIDNNNTYYPAQKESVSYSSGNTLINLSAYLAYGNQASFTGTWKAVITYIS